MTVIAMTREIGTLGRDVASGLAERLKLTVVHDGLIEHGIAERVGMLDGEVHRYFEGEATLLERWRTDKQRLAHKTAEQVLELATCGNVLVRGWGAAYLLREISHVVSIRICAPMPFRQRVLIERGVSKDDAQAQREIRRRDSAYSAVMQRMFGFTGIETANYALALNTARIPVASCVEQIVQLAESPEFQKTAVSHQELLDALVGARVRAVVEQSIGPNISGYGVDVHVTNGTVVLSGFLDHPGIIAKVANLVKGVEGVNDIENKIMHVPYRYEAA